MPGRLRYGSLEELAVRARCRRLVEKGEDKYREQHQCCCGELRSIVLPQPPSEGCDHIADDCHSERCQPQVLPSIDRSAGSGVEATALGAGYVMRQGGVEQRTGREKQQA